MGYGLYTRGRNLGSILAKGETFPETFRPVLGHTQPPSQCVSRDLSCGSPDRYVKLTVHFHLVPRLRTIGAVFLLPAIYPYDEHKGDFTYVLFNKRKYGKNV
jgi:hypothetical protein